MDFVRQYLDEVAQVARRLDPDAIGRIIDVLATVREARGRLFILGVGGSAGNASHAVNDFRKIAGIEAYAPTDNVSELTARINDDGWESSFANWLRGSRLREGDCVLVFSVGGGDAERGVSVNLVRAVEYAKSAGARSEEHTSELQSQSNLVCRLLLEKKKNRRLGTSSAGRLPYGRSKCILPVAT